MIVLIIFWIIWIILARADINNVFADNVNSEGPIPSTDPTNNTSSSSNTDKVTTLATTQQGENASIVDRGNETSTVATAAATRRAEKKRTHHWFKHVDRKKLEESCAEAKDCPSSEQYWLVCGSDGESYRNIGLLACAQRCKTGLKLKGFGPCENSRPLDPSTLPTISTSTTGKPKEQELKELTNETTKEIFEYLKSRIQLRHKHRGWPPELETWCRDNPDECPYGYDPSIHRGVYIIPALPYEEVEHEPERHFT